MASIWIMIILTNGVCMGLNGMQPKTIEFKSQVACEEAKAQVQNRCIQVSCVRHGLSFDK